MNNERLCDHTLFMRSILVAFHTDFSCLACRLYEDADVDDMDGLDTTELEQRLERRIERGSAGDSGGVRLEALPGGRGHLMRNQEPDTISYVSQASERSDLLY